MAVRNNILSASANSFSSSATESAETTAGGRMAVVIDGTSHGISVDSITERVPTAQAESLRDVVEALQAHHLGGLSGEQGHDSELLLCVDITELATADTILLAEGLSHSRACGVILAMTAAQLSLFDRALFGFVLEASAA
jgi:hypothetical protein